MIEYRVLAENKFSGSHRGIYSRLRKRWVWFAVRFFALEEHDEIDSVTVRVRSTGEKRGKCLIFGSYSDRRDWRNPEIFINFFPFLQEDTIQNVFFHEFVHLKQRFEYDRISYEKDMTRPYHLRIMEAEAEDMSTIMCEQYKKHWRDYIG